MLDKVNINFESHLKIIDKSQSDKPKTILSARLFNDVPKRLNSTQEGNTDDRDIGSSKHKN